MLNIFFIFISAGFIMGIVLSTSRIPLVFVKKGKKAVKILCDINYAVFLIIVMPQLFLIFNNGGADLYCFLGLIIGFILYYKFIKFPLDRVVEKLYNRIISGNFLTQKQKDKIDK